MNANDGRDSERAALAQQHQLDTLDSDLSRLERYATAVEAQNADQSAALGALDQQMAALYASMGIERPTSEQVAASDPYAPLALSQDQLQQITQAVPDLRPSTEHLSFNGTWEAYLAETKAYLDRHSLDLSEQPFSDLLSPQQRSDLEARIRSDFTFQTASCDQLDYALAAGSGLIGGLIDMLFVKTPDEGLLTQLSDESTDKCVEKFASFCGWKGPREGSDPTSSAIGFLERKFKVNYDHRHTPDTDGLVANMSAKNHHIKNLAHSPDLIGLVFSLVAQFTSQAHFFSEGQVIAVDAATMELKGNNFPAKVFSAFVNWFGHLASDVAGSSGAQKRGAGIPMPFFNLLQLVDVGEFGQHRQTFATVAVKVFESGYDSRHATAMAVPVMVTELLVRLCWTLKQKFYHSQPWKNCLPSASNPELRRMLLVGHGALCIVDTADAALNSEDEIVEFLLRTNVIGWVRFGTLALQELKAWAKAGCLDLERIDTHIEAEYQRLLEMPITCSLSNDFAVGNSPYRPSEAEQLNALSI